MITQTDHLADLFDVIAGVAAVPSGQSRGIGEAVVVLPDIRSVPAVSPVRSASCAVVRSGLATLEMGKRYNL